MTTERTWNVPAVDVYESETAWRLMLDLPRVQREDLELTTKDGRLELVAKNDHTELRRSFRLPRGADDTAMNAHLEHGVLTVDIEKPEAARPRRIAIA